MTSKHYSAPELDIVLESSHRADVLRVRGELDITTVPLLEQAITDAAADRPLVIDLAACRYLDCSVLGVLIRTLKRLGPKLCLVIPEGARIRQVFSIAKLDTVFHIEKSIERAET